MTASKKVVMAGHHDVSSLRHVVSRRKYSRRRGNTSCCDPAIHAGAQLSMAEALCLQPKRVAYGRLDVIYSGDTTVRAGAKLSTAMRVHVLSLSNYSQPCRVAHDRERAVHDGAASSAPATNYL